MTTSKRLQQTNPEHLFRLFVISCVIFFILIVMVTGYGILRISRQAAIAEAEHDAIEISRAFLGKEGEFLLSTLRKCPPAADTSAVKAKAAAGKEAAAAPAPRKAIYTVQIGSFRKAKGGITTYERAAAALPRELGDLRLEKVNGLFAVRVGALRDRAAAHALLDKVRAVYPGAILLHVDLLPERLVRPQPPAAPPTPQAATQAASPPPAAPAPAATSVVFDLSRPENQAYDARLRAMLKTLSVAKLKVFSLDRIIVYSTERSLIGKDNSKNHRLALALSGKIDSEFKAGDSLPDLVDETVLARDVVETYLPVRGTNGEIIGAFEIYMDITRYREDTRRRVERSVAVIAGVLAVVFLVLGLMMRRGTRALSRIQEELFRLSAIDGLTGLLNRRYLYERIAEEFSRIDLKNRKKKLLPSMGCIMVDIDFFKKFNDTYGHQVGDEVLKFVAGRIEASLRKYDVAGRYGGEEFLILLPNSSLEDTRMVAERVWSYIRGEAYVHEGSSYQVTVSVGYACITDHDDTYEAAIGRADQALYLAKEGGRDQVRTIEDEGAADAAGD